MFRKTLMTLTVLFVLPAFAHAWIVNSKSSPLTGQGTISPAGNRTYSAGANSQEYSVVPAAGFKLSRVTLDGAPLSQLANGRYVAPYNGLAWRYMVAYFAVDTVSITTQIIPAGTGAMHEDTYESLTKIPLGSGRQILVIPNTGYAIASITADGATITDNGNGTQTVAYSNLQTTRTVTATFSLTPVVSVSAGNDITANGQSAEFAATLYGSATSNQGAITYAWSGAGLGFGSPGAAITTVYGADPGVYFATLTVSSGQEVRTDTSRVTILDRTAYLETLCSGCHSGNTDRVVSDYDSSGHKAKHVSCQECHSEAPHTDVVATCVACHASGNSRGLPWPPTGLSFHNAYSGTNLCDSCHELHNPSIILPGAAPYPHYNNFSTAQYVTANIACDNCHSSLSDASFHLYPAHTEWGGSGKGNIRSASWTAYDFKTRGTPAPATPENSTGDDCVRCHTSTGYINYLTSGYKDITAWGTSGLAVDGDRTREMIACKACHNTPFDAEFSTRGFQRDKNGRVISWGPAVPSGYYNYSSAATGKILIRMDLPASVGISNICVACHTGTAAGATIMEVAYVTGQRTGPFWQNVDFINPHYMGAAGIVFGMTGYTYRNFADYDNPGSYIHNGLGDGQVGNCVTCHVSSADKHSHSPVTRDANGVITAITSARCNDCHEAGSHPIPDGAALEAFRSSYRASLQAVAELLAVKEIYFDRAQYPYFFTGAAEHSFANRTVNWDAAAPLFKGADIMGAAFNLKLLEADAGSYVHNSFYTKRLLYDTIDFLDNGNQDSSVAVAIQNIVISQSFTEGMKSQALSYIGTRP